MTQPDAVCEICGATEREKLLSPAGYFGSYCVDGCGVHDHPKRRFVTPLSAEQLDELEAECDCDAYVPIESAHLRWLIERARQ